MGKISSKARVKIIRAKILPILKSSGVTRAAVFGSAARGEMRKNSDIDILVDMPKNIGLLDFVAVKLRLEKALGRKVDLVEYGAIKQSLKKSILKDQVSVL
jgi:predicted nucleotidyltransferase